MNGRKIKGLVVAFFAVCILLIQGNLAAFAAEMSEKALTEDDVVICVSNENPSVGEQVQCWLEVTSDEADYTVEWRSNSTYHATVDKNGLATMKNAGIVSICADIRSGGKSFTVAAELTVSIIPITEIILSQEQAILNVGETLQLTAEILPANSTYKDITWTSDKENVATVDENGLVKAKSKGTATIEVDHWAAKGAKTWCVVQVIEPDAEPKTGVNLYKNDTLVGNYDSINKAFDLMTDAKADYTLELCENQILKGYAQWPKVKSIKIMPLLNYYDYGEATILALTEKSTTFNSDVCISDWICITPAVYSYENYYYDLNIQNYELTFDCEIVGHYVYVGDTSILYNAGFNIVGGEASKLTLNTLVQFFHSSINVGTVELVTSEKDGSDVGGNMTLYYCHEKNNIDKLMITNQLEDCTHIFNIGIKGYKDLKTIVQINDVIFNASNDDRSIEFSVYNMADVQINNMAENSNLTVDLGESKTSTFSYLGPNVLNQIFVRAYVYLLDEDASNTLDVRLLYAPHVASEKIEFLISVFESYGSTDGRQYIYTGRLSGKNGYYYSKNVPTFSADRRAYIAEGALSKTLYYELKNGTEDFVSVKWEAETLSPPYDGTALSISGYDEKHVDFVLSQNDRDYCLVGTFDYKYGQGRVEIPIFASAKVSNVSLSETELKAVYAGDISLPNKISIDLSYDSKDTPVIVLVTSNPKVINNMEVKGKTITADVVGEGTAVLSAYVGEKIVTCKVIATYNWEDHNGWHEAMNGNWYYYKDDVVDSSVNGIVRNGNEYWYAKDGMADFTMTTVAKYGTGWWYVKNGKIDFSYSGLGNNSSGWWYIKNGKVDFSYTGLAKYNGSWWYIKNGKLDFAYTGLAKYSGSWWYIKSGKLDFSYTGLAKYSGSWWYIKSGKLDFGYTGLCQYNGSWYYVQKGVLNWNYTGLCQYNGSWYYVQKGVLNWKYTGLCKYGSSWYYVQKGVLNWNYTGLCQYNGSWYYVQKGVLNWNYTGLCKYGSNWYYVQKGVLNWNYTGLCKYGSSWYYVQKGVLNWNYTGLCKYGSSWYYVQKGVLNWNYTGYTNYGGLRWYVKSGVMVRKA